MTKISYTHLFAVVLLPRSIHDFIHLDQAEILLVIIPSQHNIQKYVLKMEVYKWKKSSIVLHALRSKYTSKI